MRKKFGTSVVEIAFADDEEAMKALGLLHSLDYVSECKRNGLKITISVEDGKTSTLLGTLMKNNVEVEEIKNDTKSLEDIYLTIVR